MPARLPWTQRVFTFDFPVDLFPDVIERLRGLAPRIDAKVRACLPPDLLTRREREGLWSIQENIGHLLDLEPLGLARLDEYLRGSPGLSPADMTNRRTHEARYNDRPIAGLFAELAAGRRHFVDRLDALDPSDFSRTALHPRLQIPMRLVDWLTFVAAHDDYHLARMSELMRIFGLPPA